ncbi:MAG TPA: hypothetical protein PKE12_05985 [Kiritimatiellia bacterium]|nr:hypothetical protein [Kiritimatiellia bacterium]
MTTSNNQTPGNGKDDFVQRLLALKRHEQPDPYFETRSLARLRDELRDTAPGASWASRLWEAFTGSPVPLLRVAAVCVIAVLAVNLWTLNSTTEQAAPASAPVMVELTPEPVTAEPVMLASTNDSTDLYRKPVFVFEYPSNRQPMRSLQMGPSSVPVRYDY